MREISDRHRMAKLQAGMNRLRCQAMEAAFTDVTGSAPPPALADPDLEARMALARRWDDLRAEIRSSMADGGSWSEIASRVLPVGEEIVARRGLWPLLRVWATSDRSERV